MVIFAASIGMVGSTMPIQVYDVIKLCIIPRYMLTFQLMYKNKALPVCLYFTLQFVDRFQLNYTSLLLAQTSKKQPKVTK